MAGTWSTLQNPPTFNVDTMLLLTDGTVMCHEYQSPNWHKLTPDPFGDYTKGNWSSMAALLNDATIPAAKGGPAYAPTYFVSAVLKDGTVFVAGGEYNGTVSTANDTLAAQLYNPLSDSWTTLSTPSGWTQIGDAASCVLPDGRVLLGNIGNSSIVIYNPVLSVWTTAANKNTGTSEETLTLLPDNTILTVDCQSGTNAEKYIINTDQWVPASSTPNTLPQACPGFVAEIGPALLLPDGRVFAIGATGNTALYTAPANPTQPGTWANGPTITDTSGNTSFPMDAPAVLLPNGKVLLIGSPTPPCSYPGPTTFFEYDPATNTATQITNPANSGNPAFQGRMLLLPTGQVLFGANTSDIRVYTPDGSPQASWRPTITTCPSALISGHTYQIAGRQINGLSQACSYGDDAQMATNYPLVQVRNTATNHKTFLRTANHSTMGVATGAAIHTTNISVPGDLAPGQYELVIIANGISSAPQIVNVGTQDCFFIVDRSTFGQGEVQAMINLNGHPAIIDPALYVVVEGFKPSDLGINGPADLASPARLPMIPNPHPQLSFVFSGPVIPENPALPNLPQRFTFPFKAVFQDDSMFNFGPSSEPVTVQTVFTSTLNTTVVSAATILLIKNPNPYILHGDQRAGLPWYLSMDVKVFQMTAGDRKFATNLPTSGDVSAVASTFITSLINNLNSNQASAGSFFDSLPTDEAAAALSLAPTNAANVPIYNFALARVRCQDLADALDVRVFFRLWACQQTNATFDTTTTYRQANNGAGQKIATLGIQGDELITIPFFASPRVNSAVAGLNTQTDPANIKTIHHSPIGGEVDTYYGCWLDINQPTQLRYPNRLTGNVDGPFNGTLFPIQQFMRSAHQCLIAQISFDPDPIPNTADPSISDKLAQRNLTFVGIPNPGVLASRRAPQTFEIRPTPAFLPQGQHPDELMIEWGNTPEDSMANLYLPGVGADRIIALANEYYLTHRLTQLDANTIQCETGGVTYVPIPTGTDVNFAGLMTIDLPVTVKKGQVYGITVRQVTGVRGPARELKQDSNNTVHLAVHHGVNTPETTESQSVNFRSVTGKLHQWRRTLGMFRFTIPVSTKTDLLAPEERFLSILRWIQTSISVESRWFPVFNRYVDQVADRVQFMGGDPDKVKPTPDGNWYHDGNGHDHDHKHDHDITGQGEKRISYTGKIAGLEYDHFGDFAGFMLETEEGERHFVSRENEVETLIHGAWTARVLVSVIVERHEPHLPQSIILRGGTEAVTTVEDDA